MSQIPADTRIVVDTDVISYIHKGDSRADLYQPHLEGRGLVISFMTVAELERWALKKRWGADLRAKLDVAISKCLISAPDRGLCRSWARVHEEARLLKPSRSITESDAWIAATAWHLGVPLVTHNRRHYEWLRAIHVISES